ncbi:MAG: tetratricopeptide repeat protein, partial [Nitrospinota bacterium]|nr:tetratricopeptide repeat protein [Nitrospinota bacterium]
YRDLERNSFDRIDIFRKARRQFIKRSLSKGRIELNDGETGLAIKTYRKLLDYDRSIVEAHRGLIRSYATIKKIDKIIEEYKKKVNKSLGTAAKPGPGEAKQESPAHVEIYSLGLALTYLDPPQLDDAIDLIKQSITLNSQVSPYHQTLGWLYEQKGILDKKADYLERALEENQMALAFNDENEYPENEANLLLNYANTSFNLQNFDTAYRYFKLRLDTGVPFENLDRESLFYQRFGQSAFKQGEYAQAADYYHKALRQAEKKNDLNRQAELNDRLALSYQELGKYKKANDYFSRVLSLNKKSKNVKNISITLRNMANNLYALGETETGPEKTENLAKALKSYTESMDALEKYGVKEAKKKKKRGLFSFEFEKAVGTESSAAAIGFDRTGEEKLIFNYLGKIYKDFHDYDKSISYYEKKLKLTPAGLKLKGNAPVLTERAIILNQVGSLYYRKGNIFKSLDYFKKSLELSTKLNNIHGVIVNSTNIGKIEVEEYIQQPSIPLLTESLAFIEKGKTLKEPLQIISLKNYLSILHFHLAMDKDRAFTPVSSTGSMQSGTKPEKIDAVL